MMVFKIGQKVELPNGKKGIIEKILDNNKFHGRMYYIRYARKTKLGTHTIEGSNWLKEVE